jgi:predicted alpha/beta-fold hydrolase
VQASAAVSTPLDLTISGRAIGQGFNRLYTYHFLWTLIPKSLRMAARYPGRLSTAAIYRVRSIWDFDQVVTAPLHGFASADDYWERASSKSWLRAVRVPTLVLNGRNDPFVPEPTLPSQADVSSAVVLDQPAGGGHVGFASGPFPGHVGWLPERLLHFFSYGV